MRASALVSLSMLAASSAAAQETEARDERRGLSVAVKEPHAQPLAPAAAPVRARHVRRGPGLVDEHELLGIEIGLRLEPGAALAQDVRTVLLDRMSGLFFRVMPRRWKKRDRAELDAAMPRSAKRTRSSSRL